MTEGYTEVFAWGGDHFGQLGLGGKVLNKTYPSPRFCSFNIIIKEISCGEEHSAFISNSGHVYTMGSNTDGRLGIGSRTIRNSASPCLVEDLSSCICSKVSCGWAHTAVITETGDVFVWGLGEFGALGTGSTESRYSPAQMSLPRGQVIDVSCGSRHTGIILKDKTGKKSLFMTGGGEAGQLGTGRREKELSPIPIDLPEDAEQVSCGVFHTGIVSTRGSVFTMGGNSFGQLGLGNKKSQNRAEKVTSLEGVIIKKVRCNNFSAAISDKGVLFIWGSGIFGEYLLPHRWTLREPVVDLALGAGFGVAVDATGSVHVWGGNSNGELGLDDYEIRATPTLVPSLKGKSLKKVACGGNFCIGLGSDVNLKCKTPERKRKVEENEGQKPKFDEVDKLSLEVRQTYKGYEELKRNFEILSEKYEGDRRNSGKVVEELNREVMRYKQELERYRSQIEMDDREIRELNSCLNEAKRNSHEVMVEASAYKEELSMYKRQLEDSRNLTRNELKKIDEAREHEISGLQDMISFESSKRKMLEKELEKAENMIQEYENSIRTCQQDLNDLTHEFQENSSKSDLERKRLQTQIEKYSKDLGDQFKKNEVLSAEKEKIQSMMKNELDKYFKENKELKFQVELLKEQLDLKVYENSEIMKNLKILSSEKQATEHSLSDEIERVNYEKQKKIESLLAENEKIKQDNSGLMRNLEVLTRKLENSQEIEEELQRLEKENIQLNNKINYLVLDNEKLNAGLSAEIETLSNQKAQLIEKYDDLYLEKERKMHSLSNEYEKTAKDFLEIKAKLDSQSQENERLKTRAQHLSEDLKISRSQNEQIVQENKRNVSMMQEASRENSDLLSKIHSLTREKEEVLSKLHSLTREKEEVLSKLHSITREKEDLLSKIHSLTKEKEEVLSQLSREKEQISAHLAQVSKEKDFLSRDHSELFTRHSQFQKEKDDQLQRLSLSNKEKQDQLEKLLNQVKMQEDTINSLKLTLSSQENHLLTLKSDLDSSQCEIQELHMVIDHARQEKAQISSVLSDEISIKSSEMQKWVAQSSMKDKEIAFLKQILNDRESEVNRSQESLKNLLDENSLAKRQLDEMRHDLETIHLRVSEKEFLIKSVKETSDNWQGKYSECMKDNSNLRGQVSELEAKNRQLFENLERELAQRAKDYKERTMNILTMPRSNSPGLRPPTPDGRVYSRIHTPMMSIDRTNIDDYSGNTAARLLSTLEASPKNKNLVRTPTKEDLKAKIANLMENRTRIENELRGLDEE
jgi:X-linked retinitis pigmentosa GTPase regulator